MTASMTDTADLYKFYIETLGCPKNRVDSRRMRHAMLKAGFIETENVEEADISLINSCSFIKEAQEETIDTVFSFLDYKKKKESFKVGLIGCFAERFSEEVRAEIPELDLSVGTGKYHLVADEICRKFNIQPVKHEVEMLNRVAGLSESTLPYSYFRIAQGCSRSCAFCILPVIRGSLSRYKISDLQRQIEEEQSSRESVPLREAILVSQDTISQGQDELRRIIEFLSEMPDLSWIRLQYLFPDRRVLKLLDLFEEFPKLVSYLDIPFQHFSTAVLKRMNRPYDTGLFREILQKAESVRPDIEIRTSIIAGFPGETGHDIEIIEEFLTENAVHKLSLFRYSHEKGTPAGVSDETVSDEVKVERINRLRDLHLSLREPYRRSLVNKKELMMIDAIDNNEITARRQQDSPEIDEVVFVQRPADSTVKPGQLHEIELNMPLEYDWVGELVSNEEVSLK